MYIPYQSSVENNQLLIRFHQQSIKIHQLQIGIFIQKIYFFSKFFEHLNSIQDLGISLFKQQQNFQMHNYKGQVRRERQDFTPTKSSWDRDMIPPQPPKNQRYDSKFEKSEISYYQSQGSRVLYDYDRQSRPNTRSQVHETSAFSYNENKPFRIKSFEREDYHTMLRIQIQMKTEKNYSIILINLTDDNNPKFLWSFNIRQMDFINLKNEQKLKVDYSSFPEMLENLLDSCISQKQARGEQKSLMHLLFQIKKGGEGTIYLNETNRYKESTHLYLHFKMSNDEQIKEYLAAKLLTAQQELERNFNKINHLQNTLSARMVDLETKEAQLKEECENRQRIITQLRMDEQRKSNERESNFNQQLNRRIKEHEAQFKEAKQSADTQIKSVNAKNKELSTKLSEAKERIVILESVEKEMTSKIARLEQDLKKHEYDESNLREENKRLSNNNFQLEKKITELTCKIESQRGELEDKKTIINSTIQLKQTNNNQIASLEQQNNELKKTVNKLEAKISQLESERQKLNISIKEKVQKISKNKEKMSKFADIMKIQEREINDLKVAKNDSNRQNEDLKIRNTDKDLKIKKLQEQIEICQQKLQDQNAMVMHLQKSLNERPAIRPSYNYQPSYTSSNLNRDNITTISNNSNISSSRIAQNTASTKPMGDKFQPTIKRYQERSKSPVPNRLNQQRQPQDEDLERLNQVKPKPVKFKFSKMQQQ